MTNKDLAVLQEKLELKERSLDLVLAIDHIRDTAPDPTTMLATIVNVVAEHLRAELCTIALINKETEQVELKAIYDRSLQQRQLITLDLAKEAAYLEQINIWHKTNKGDTWPDNLQMAAVPIVMNEDERLGSLLLARIATPFTTNDVKLLDIAESMIDSAVIQGYADHELKQRIKELEAIYTIDNIRDLGLPFDEMLNRVIQELCQVINAEMGFTMLYDNSGKQLELRAVTHDNLFQIAKHHEHINQLAHESLQKPQLLCRNELGDKLRSIMCLPLILNEQIIGVLGVINRNDIDRFTLDDQRLLNAIGSQIDTAIFENMEKRHLRRVLGRSVDPQIMTRLLAHRC